MWKSTSSERTSLSDRGRVEGEHEDLRAREQIFEIHFSPDLAAFLVLSLSLGLVELLVFLSGCHDRSVLKILENVPQFAIPFAWVMVGILGPLSK